MNKTELVIKNLLLLILEYKLNGNLVSTSLVKATLKELKNNVKKPKVFNDEEIVIEKILALIESILNEKTIPDEGILVNIELILAERPGLLKIIKKYIENDKNIEKNIEALKEEINNQITRLKLIKLFSSINNRLILPNTDIQVLINEIKENLESISDNVVLELEGLVDEIDFDNDQSVTEAAQRAADLVTGSIVFKTGWKCINDMTQGGFRRSEFVTISALQHSYKSSMTKTLFLQLMKHNPPKVLTKGKKPMFMLISLEEEVDNIMFFFYQYLKFNYENITIDNKAKKNLNPLEISNYVKNWIRETGYNVRVYRFRPELLTHSKLENLVLAQEKLGYEVQAVFLDYVKKMSREGVRSTGPQGTDLLDLFSRIRNFMSANKILFVTPHQLSTDAKRLARSGLPPIEFVQHIAHKGYYADSSQLDQEIDLELFLHKAKIGKDTFVLVQRGKHRIPTTISEDDMFTMLKFQNPFAPIPEENEHHNEVCVKQTNNNDEFDF